MIPTEKKINFTSTITGATILLSVVGILSRGLGFLKEMVFAWYFGLSLDYDIYLVGAVLPLTVNTIFLYLGQNYIIPAGKNINENSDKTITDLISTNFYLFIGSGFLLSLLMFTFSEDIVLLYLKNAGPDVISTALGIFNLYLISIPISGAISVLAAYHQLNFNFKYPAYSGLILSILNIILILIFTNSFGIFVIPIGYLFGLSSQLIYLLFKTPITLAASFNQLKSVGKYTSQAILIIILIESIGQLYILADRYFWEFLPVGGLAALNFSQNLFLLPISILSMTLSTAIFPKFSDEISRGDFTALNQIFIRSVRFSMMLFIPITIILIFYGDRIIALFYERGNFSGSDTKITHQVLVFYSISLVFYAVYGISNKMLYSLGIIKELLLITLSGILLKIICNFLFVPKLQQNGLALSTSVSYLFFTFTSFYFIIKKIKSLRGKIYFHDFGFHIINVVISFAVVKLVILFVSDFKIIQYGEIVLFSVIVFANLLLVKYAFVNTFFNILNHFLPLRFRFGR